MEKRQGESFEWRYWRRGFWKRSNEFNWDKSPINMTSDHSVWSNNHQINMISDHSVSSNNHQINMISDHSVWSNNHQINMTSDHSLSSNNHQINMTSDHSLSSNNSFKSHLNAKSFNMFLTLHQLYEARWFYFSVCCNGDVNVWEWYEFGFSRKLKRTLIMNNIHRSTI